MIVSKKAYYGLRAALALAQSNEPLSIHDLAQNEHLPQDYLEKILQGLRKAGIVEAKKGTTGGYFLARKAEDTNVWEILKVLDGPIKTFMPPIKGELPCFIPSHCQTNEIWRTLEMEIEQTLSKITLAHLIPQTTKEIISVTHC